MIDSNIVELPQRPRRGVAYRIPRMLIRTKANLPQNHYSSYAVDYTHNEPKASFDYLRS